LKEKLNNLKTWCDTNELHLNVSECHVITFTRKKLRHEFSYKIGTVNLDRVKTMSDLGILLDEKLTFKPHCDLIISKSNMVF
jgi:hypothetical protein